MDFTKKEILIFIGVLFVTVIAIPLTIVYVDFIIELISYLVTNITFIH